MILVELLRGTCRKLTESWFGDALIFLFRPRVVDGETAI